MAVITVRETGAAGTLRALKLLDKDVAKGLEKEMNAAGAVIVDDAKGYVPAEPPLRNWRPGPPRRSRSKRGPDGRYTGAAVRGGEGWPGWISSTMQSSIGKTRREFVITARSRDASLMIYELAGTKSDGHSPQGRAFVANLPAVPRNVSGRKHGRVLIASVRKNYRATAESIDSVVERAKAACRERLSS